MEYDMFGKKIEPKIYHVNIYADEIMNKRCPYTNDVWRYIGIIVEDISKPILDDLIKERFMNNFDINSPYYKKNNKIIHWSNISSMDEINICKRWFNYIKNNEKFYFYLLGLNVSKLNKEEFDPENEFNSIYNRFFRSAVLYGLKTFFSGEKVNVINIYHEEGQQQYHRYFPWHLIYKINQQEDNIYFSCDQITFLTKDHTKTKESNILQLCDALMGAVTTIIHGFKPSKRARNREQLLEIILDIVELATSSKYITDEWVRKHFIIRFFPKEKTNINDFSRYRNQFYNNRRLNYLETIQYGGKSLFDL